MRKYSNQETDIVMNSHLEICQNEVRLLYIYCSPRYRARNGLLKMSDKNYPYNSQLVKNFKIKPAISEFWNLGHDQEEWRKNFRPPIFIASMAPKTLDTTFILVIFCLKWPLLPWKWRRKWKFTKHLEEKRFLVIVILPDFPWNFSRRAILYYVIYGSREHVRSTWWARYLIYVLLFTLCIFYVINFDNFMVIFISWKWKISKMDDF